MQHGLLIKTTKLLLENETLVLFMNFLAPLDFLDKHLIGAIIYIVPINKVTRRVFFETFHEDEHSSEITKDESAKKYDN